MTGIKKYAVLASMMIALCSCIDDNFSGCPPSNDGGGNGGGGIGTPNPDVLTLFIGFENVKPEYAAEVNRLDVFVFDSLGIFSRAQSEEDISLTPGFRIRTLLFEGEYRFVVWSDLGGHYMTAPAELEPDVTTFDEAIAMLNTTGGSVIDYDLHTFLHGNEQAKITSDTLIILPLVQNTYKINVTVEGLEKGHEYSVAIADDNANYYFDNNFAPSGALQYIRGPIAAPEGELSESLIILRLDRDRSPEFTIIDNTTQSVLLEKDLVEMILALEDETGVPVDFPTQHEFTAHIVYDWATMSATVYIDGWQVKTDEPAVLD